MKQSHSPARVGLWNQAAKREVAIACLEDRNLRFGEGFQDPIEDARLLHVLVADHRYHRAALRGFSDHSLYIVLTAHQVELSFNLLGRHLANLEKIGETTRSGGDEALDNVLELVEL